MNLSPEDEEILSKFFGPSEINSLKKRLQGYKFDNTDWQAFHRLKKHFEIKDKLVEELEAIHLLGVLLGWETKKCDCDAGNTERHQESYYDGLEGR